MTEMEISSIMNTVQDLTAVQDIILTGPMLKCCAQNNMCSLSTSNPESNVNTKESLRGCQQESKELEPILLWSVNTYYNKGKQLERFDR